MTAEPRKILVLGGARSGKTRHALHLAERTAGPLAYLATAEARDGEMRERIARHRAERGPRWRTVEEPLDLVGAIGRHADAEGAVLVDCLTLWLGNLMEAGLDAQAEGRHLAESLSALPGRILLVSNEVGLGIVPDNALARRFRDEAGRLHQALAARADHVVFMVAGLPMTVK
ncbi:MAG TPA: bifunctional adenosylcobinamide kinase/adenosylcobinamide-phosphate guanylyltransferase [Arenibaculum sp.]|nr:bifunctional adenosylcobinamide kinase/adenosylcobinamide-phosphate guanylyltransferase [Arenibaculum sp.]